jgi:hypothetical protein
MPRRELRGTDAFYTLIGTKERAGARSMGARRDQSAIAQSCTKKKDNVTKIFPPFMPRAYPTTEKKGNTEAYPVPYTQACPHDTETAFWGAYCRQTELGGCEDQAKEAIYDNRGVCIREVMIRCYSRVISVFDVSFEYQQGNRVALRCFDRNASTMRIETAGHHSIYFTLRFGSDKRYKFR